MLERTRNFLSSLSLGGGAHPKDRDEHASPPRDTGRRDHETDGSPYVGVKVPPSRPEAASTLPPPPEQPRDPEPEGALALMRQELLDLRRDVGAVMRELLVSAVGLTPDAAAKRAAELLGVEDDRPRGDVLDLRRDVTIVMGNLLLAAGQSRDDVKRIVIDPLDPKTAKGNTPPEASDEELELERFEQELRELCDRILSREESQEPKRGEDTTQAARESEERPGPELRLQRERDRGHEW